MSNTLAKHCTGLAAHSLQRLLFLRPLDDEVPAVQVRGLERVLGGNGLLVLPHVLKGQFVVVVMYQVRTLKQVP